ncbi:MAG: MoaD/ThiS family protein [Parvularculaceae bacterium]
MARLLFFGRLGDVAGATERQIALPEGAASVETLFDLLEREDSLLAAALRDPSVRIAVNGEIRNGAGAVSDADEIAFMPPFSGG